MASTSDNQDTANATRFPDRRTPRGKLPVFRFILLMVVLLIVFNAFFYQWLSNPQDNTFHPLFERYLAINAAASAAVLNGLGEKSVTSNADVISSPKFSLGIRRGCDAIQPAVFFAFFVAASPVLASPARKAGAIALGVTLILLINLVRIVSLYYVGVYWKSAFEWVHVEFWQMAFIAIPIVFWLVWAKGQQRKTTKRSTTDARTSEGPM